MGEYYRQKERVQRPRGKNKPEGQRKSQEAHGAGMEGGDDEGNAYNGDFDLNQNQRTRKRPPGQEWWFLGTGSSRCKGWAELSLKRQENSTEPVQLDLRVRLEVWNREVDRRLGEKSGDKQGLVGRGVLF